MRKVLASAAFAAVFALSAAAYAAPTGPAPAGAAASAQDVIPVAGGCGIGFHRGPYGACRRNGPVYRPILRPHCFWRRGPYGRLVRVCRR